MNPNTKREIRRYTTKYAKVLEPVFVIAIFIAFALPIFTVINLTPETRAVKNANVLGAESTSELSITSVSGTHNVITNETEINKENGSKEYTSTIKTHNAGTYSKPVFTIKNTTTEAKQIKVSAKSEDSNSLKLGVIFKDVNYVLQSNTGELFSHTLTIDPGQEQTVFIAVESDNNVAFDQTANLNLLVQ